MKTFATAIVLTLVQFISSTSLAYILPLENILQKSALVAGSSILNVEQEVQFKEAGKTYIIKETWLIEGDRNLRLTARGQGELKEVNLNYIYNNKTRTSLSGKNKVTQTTGADFYEKYLAIKSKDSFQSYLKDLAITENVRLSRASGSVCFAIGEEANSESAVKPQLWIDQNSFRLVKMRLPSAAEVEFLDFTELESGAHYPRQKTVSWNGKTLNIVVKSVTRATSASIKNFYPESLETPSQFVLPPQNPAAPVFEEFYQRFR